MKEMIGEGKYRWGLEKGMRAENKTEDKENIQGDGGSKK